MIKASVTTSPLALVVGWTTATAIGSFLAPLSAQLLLFGNQELAQTPVDEILFGCALGLALGVGQSLAFRARLPRPSRWVISSLIGGAAIGIVASLAGDRAGSATAFATYGVILGACQWPVLRQALRHSALWIPACGLAWAIGSQCIVWTDRISQTASWPLGELGTVAVMYGLIGSVVGIVTGCVMLWMIQATDRTLRPSIPLVIA
jgi:hypothetical protein